jgi:pSer/pThr/pTyr-binding forkhead associated (FHA) protein
MRTWIIGSAGDCDVVVEQPRVSRRHCRLTELDDGYLLEDLGSSNGTYVNGVRITEATRVSTDDQVTLGAMVAMPWPPDSGMPGATILRIGRAPDNDIVLNDTRVSSYHARLIVAETHTLIEDIGSSNGTFVNSPEQQVTQPIPLAETDTVYFGSLAVPAARLIPMEAVQESVAPAPSAAFEPQAPSEQEVAPALPPVPEPRSPSEQPVAPAPPPPPEVWEAWEPAPAVPAPEPATAVPWTILLLAQAPVIAVVILVLCGRQAAAPVTLETRPAVVAGIASTMFALALSAVWLGGTLAMWAYFAGRSISAQGDSPEAKLFASPVLMLGAIGVFCVAQCAVLLAIVHRGGNLGGSWPSMFGLLLLTSAVGLSLGLLVCSLIRTPTIAAAVLMLAFLLMIALGGRIWQFTASSPASLVASAMPTRWAFEGLLLLESDRSAPADSSENTRADRPDDLAEGFFPAGPERMSPTNDVMALGFMLTLLGFVLVGRAAATVFLSPSRKPAY